ncbi:MAG: hypothetical protein GY932_11240 [Arcobacter sp.]|nr:hypothetical protein [Arcobacter sp.]
MICKKIDNLTLSANSQKNLKEIKRTLDASHQLEKFLPIATIALIFSSSTAAGKALTLTQTDFIGLTKAIKSVNSMAKRKINYIVNEQIIKSSGQEYLFWKGLKNGCDFK